MMRRIKNPKRAAFILGIVVLSVALAIRMQRRMDQVGTMDATAMDLQIEKAEMEKLLSELIEDKALLAKEHMNSTLIGEQSPEQQKHSRAMERHLQSLRRLLKNMHRRHLEAEHSSQMSLVKQNEALALQLQALRTQLSSQLSSQVSRGTPPPQGSKKRSS